MTDTCPDASDEQVPLSPAPWHGGSQAVTASVPSLRFAGTPPVGPVTATDTLVTVSSCKHPSLVSSSHAAEHLTLPGYPGARRVYEALKPCPPEPTDTASTEPSESTDTLATKPEPASSQYAGRSVASHTSQSIDELLSVAFAPPTGHRHSPTSPCTASRGPARYPRPVSVPLTVTLASPDPHLHPSSSRTTSRHSSKLPRASAPPPARPSE
mmetsp:Transcript_26748/g.64646  ORF Transcript_26748/g.64646 Transcript_26748/m.64646 type:complete len:212 (+) Transcript_26748:2573-3208(+)